MPGTEAIYIRVPAEEKEKVLRAARMNGETLTQYMRRLYLTSEEYGKVTPILVEEEK